MDVIGLGTIFVDHLLLLPQPPEVDAKIAVLEDRLQVGGPVPTALAMLRRLGHGCSFLGSWGDDAFGQMIDADLQREGIEARRISAERGVRTGVAHVWVCDVTARRTVAYHRTDHQFAASNLDRSLFRSARAVHLDGWPPRAALVAAKLAQDCGCTVMLDAGSPKPGMEELLRYVNVLNIPRRFLRQFFGGKDERAGIQTLLSMGPSLVSVTNGAQEAAIGADGELLTRPAFAIDPVDTSGAGSVFSGALLHGVLQGWALDFMLEFSIAAAALKCTAIGNREALPDRAAIERLMTAGQASQSAAV